MTSNLKKRLVYHNKGKTKSTKSHRPFNKILVLDTIVNRIEARRMEKFYKSGIGRELLKERGVA